MVAQGARRAGGGWYEKRGRGDASVSPGWGSARQTRVFFFSSRRRHTRCSRDWSSDVCSSDLGGWNVNAGHDLVLQEVRNPNGIFNSLGSPSLASRHFFDYAPDAYVKLAAANEIGRASCRERV